MVDLTPIQEQQQERERLITGVAHDSCSAHLNQILRATASELNRQADSLVRSSEISEKAAAEGIHLAGVVIESLLTDLPLDFAQAVDECEGSEMLANEEFVADAVRQRVIGDLEAML